MGERRVAAFGGTFDPIHNGHLEIARAIVRNFGLDQLLVVPAHRPPHKNARAISDAYHRYAMAALATLDEPRVSVSTIELEAPDRPYTYETVERLGTILGTKTRLFFVMGADSFEEINTWREPARILSNADVIVATRPGHEVKSSHLDERFRSSVIDLRVREGGPDLAADTDERHIYIAGYLNDGISSTEIRRRVRDNESIEGFVDPRVADYIEKYELYRR
jgi:nicotinate-nucleotide adenylyltransferase